MTRKAVSARGLFRATGKKAHVEEPREKNDFYPTPPEPTIALVKAEGQKLKQFDQIWEPAAGDGAMAKELTQLGFSVYCSDLVDRGYSIEQHNFYDFAVAPSTAIVTNPPFKECNVDKGWIRHALETLKIEYMALLLPMNWPSAGRARAKLWRDHPPARIYLMRWRIDFTGKGAPPMSNAWFVWDKSWQGEPVFRVLDKDPICAQLPFENYEAL